MNQKIELEGIGTVHLTKPKSLVAINDLVGNYHKAVEDQGQLGRLVAALVGVCWSDENDKAFPVYDLVKGDIFANGTEALDFLLKNGCVMESLYVEVIPLFSELWELMPKAKEVEAKEAFFREEGIDGSADSEDREALGA